MAWGEVMFENVALVNTLSGQSAINNQQQYPIQQPEQDDVLKFQLEMKDANKGLSPIFQAIDSEKIGEINKGVMGHIRSADSNYHDILTGMSNLSSEVSELKFRSLSQSDEGSVAVRTEADINTLSDKDFVRTPDDASDKPSSRARELLDIQGENQTKALEMMHDMTSWTIRSQMYFSNIKIIGSAITQVSQGFKTLFRSSG